eukprot:TRINITY_DN31841_c0_g1_i1.p1 TRINITY_DN31841_c0_g1~~TRINITY_DN31841_c0_g1_i1.p1  ORF type:complete len:1337 (-),score=254.77 TRINITY_DN31841_c0_g1_i1:28-4038(-)
MASRLQLPRFAAFYAEDFPAVRDPAVGMTAFGGYGAWLWRVFSKGLGEAGGPPPCPAVQRLREQKVPHLLRACRRLQDGSHGVAHDGVDFPEVFPLSSLLLSLLRLLAGGQPGPPAAPGQAVVSPPGVAPELLEPSGPLPVLAAGLGGAAAAAGAERARSVRRWLQGPPGPAGEPAWEAALMLLVQHRVTRMDVELFSPALAVPVQECLRAAAEEPRSDWLVEAYALIGREDLALMAQASEGLPGGEAAGAARRANGGTRRTRDLLEAAAGMQGANEDLHVAPSHTADPLESSEWLYRMFDKDRRAKEVARLLCSARPVTLRVPRRAEQTDLDFEQAKQSRLAQAAVRQAALCVGRGAFTLGAVRPLPTELLKTPPLVLSGRFPPQGGVQSLDPSHHKPELNVWAEFSNGVATALQVNSGPGAEVTRGWILHHKTEAAMANQANGQTPGAAQASTHAHAGFLLGLGLRGCLKSLPIADCYKYLRLQHDTTSAAVILGMAASHISSMDAGLTRMCCVHIPSMLPATFSDMEVASPVQCSAVLSLGLLFAGSGHRMMTELLVAEIGRRPTDRALHDREGYSLAAGFALGCICLGQGAEAPGLADLQLHTWLLRYIHGGPEMPMPGAATRESKQNPNQDSSCSSSLLLEPEGINLSVTSPAGCMALGLIFMRTNSEAVSARVVIPQNVFQLDYIRPDFALLRLVARSLIHFDSIEASDEWLQRQLPPFLLQLEQSAKAATRMESALGVGSDIDWLLVGQTKASLTAGACLAMGLRFAGTSNESAKQTLISRLHLFRDARRSDAHPGYMASQPKPDMDLDRNTLEMCQSVVALALGMVMAGTGDLAALRILRSLRKKTSIHTGYGVHMATHMAIGWVCLGGGRYTFDQEPLSIAALLMAAFPSLSNSLVDNRCHLQAFRHLYVLAARHRCVEAVEVDTKQPVDVQVALETANGVEAASFPRLLLASGELCSIALRSERYWPVTIRRAKPGENPTSGRWMKALEASRRLYVKRRSGHLPHRFDSLGSLGASEAWFPEFTAPEPHHLARLLQVPRAKVPAQSTRLGGLMLSWLQHAGAEGSGPLEPGSLAVSVAEWAAALCCTPAPPLPAGACELDYAGEEAALVERFAMLLLRRTGPFGAKRELSIREQQPFRVLVAQKLHECVIESKLEAFPTQLLLSLQTFGTGGLVQNASMAAGLPLVCSPASPLCSALAVDQLLAVEHFYRAVRSGIGARHRPLLTDDFLAERRRDLTRSFEGSALSARLGPGLTAKEPREADATLAAVFCRLHGLSGQDLAVDKLLTAGGSLFSRLPQLRRQLPGASVEGLRQLLSALRLQVGQPA